MIELFIFLLATGAAVAWWQLMQGRHKARVAAKQVCTNHGLQLLDDTVSLDSVTLNLHDKNARILVSYGFEFATKDLVAQVTRQKKGLVVRLLATGRFPQAVCTLARREPDAPKLLRTSIDLSPATPVELKLDNPPNDPISITVTSRRGQVLASFTTPLPVAKTKPSPRADYLSKPDEALTAEQLYLKGRKHDRATDRPAARKYYELALERDARHVAALRSLAVLDFESGRYKTASTRLQESLTRDSSNA